LAADSPISRTPRILLIAIVIAVAFVQMYKRLAPNSGLPDGIYLMAALVGLAVAALVDSFWVWIGKKKGGDDAK